MFLSLLQFLLTDHNIVISLLYHLVQYFIFGCCMNFVFENYVILSSCMNDSNYFFTQEVDIQSGGRKKQEDPR